MRNFKKFILVFLALNASLKSAEISQDVVNQSGQSPQGGYLNVSDACLEKIADQYYKKLSLAQKRLLALATHEGLDFFAYCQFLPEKPYAEIEDIMKRMDVKIVEYSIQHVYLRVLEIIQERLRLTLISSARESIDIINEKLNSNCGFNEFENWDPFWPWNRGNIYRDNAFNFISISAKFPRGPDWTLRRHLDFLSRSQCTTIYLPPDRIWVINVEVLLREWKKSEKLVCDYLAPYFKD